MRAIIEFHPSDIEHPIFEELAELIAKHTYRYKGRINDLNTFMRVSGGRNHLSMARTWINAFVTNRKKAAADKLEFVTLLERMFVVCKNQEEWNKMRGLIPEKIFEKYFSEKHEHATIGYGVIVAINQVEVLYRPNNFEEGDGNRQTVDAGSWNGDCGEFAEVKFQPQAFGKKEFGYLELLETQLNNAEVEHQILLVSFDDAEFIKRKLIQKGFLKEDTKYKVLGHNDII